MLKAAGVCQTSRKHIQGPERIFPWVRRRMANSLLRFFFPKETQATGNSKLDLVVIGSLSVLLRNALAARKLDPTPIIFMVDDPVLRRRVQQELCSKGRL